MPLTKRIEVDKIEINADGQTSIRTATVIEEDGVELTRSFHRKVLEPGDDLDGEDPRVVAVLGADWTPARVNAHAAAKAARAAEGRDG
jgi:urease accessory protein UreE